MAAYGRVFFRWRAGTAGVHSLVARGARVAYDTTVRLNGADGRLTVLDFRVPSAEVVRELRRVFPALACPASGGTLCHASVSTERHSFRFTVVELPAYGRTAVFALEQTAAQFGASRRAPPRHELEAVPAYPGSDPLFSAADRRGGLGIAVSRVPDGPETVHAFFDSALSRDGWRPAFPSRGAAGSPLGLYVRGREVCCVLVEASPDAPANRLTLLHKQPGMK
jgi:hypothetical protein